MNFIIVLAMHGVPPRDFPNREMAEFFQLHARFGHHPHHSDTETAEVKKLFLRYEELERKIRGWPRTYENDPFFLASQTLGKEIERKTGYEVVIGFNEFCAPSLEQALELAAEKEPDKVFVLTPMLTAGGEHSEVDIPATIRRVQERHHDIPFQFAWPFDVSETAEFLAAQLSKFA